MTCLQFMLSHTVTSLLDLRSFDFNPASVPYLTHLLIAVLAPYRAPFYRQCFQQLETGPEADPALSVAAPQIAETYAFLPREAVTRFLMSCGECQKRMHISTAGQDSKGTNLAQQYTSRPHSSGCAQHQHLLQRHSHRSQ